MPACYPISVGISDSHLISELALFESLDADQVARLTKTVNSQVLKAGDVVFVEGVADATLYVLVAGVVELSRKTSAGGTELLGRIGAGEYVGEIGLLTGDPHPASAIACSRCRVLEVSKDALSHLIEERPELVIAIEQDVQGGLQLLGHSSSAHGALRSGATAHLLERIHAFFLASQIGQAVAVSHNRRQLGSPD